MKALFKNPFKNNDIRKENFFSANNLNTANSNYYVDNISEGYKINASTEEGYIEGVEISDLKFHIGIQWHTEISYDFDENSKKIIDFFINVCKKQ